jgi:hypothetical protein
MIAMCPIRRLSINNGAELLIEMGFYSVLTNLLAKIQISISGACFSGMEFEAVLARAQCHLASRCATYRQAGLDLYHVI